MAPEAPQATQPPARHVAAPAVPQNGPRPVHERGRNRLSRTAVYLFETGCPQPLPGFAPDYPFASLPFWGNHCLADFAIASFAGDNTDITIVVDDPDRGLSHFLQSRWRKPVAAVRLAKEGIGDIRKLVSSCAAEHVVLASLSSACILAPGAALALCQRIGGEVAKISIQQTPIEAYCARKESIVALLGAEDRGSTPGQRSRQCLFEGVLLSGIDLIEDLPGRILFQNDLTDFYSRNIWAIANCTSKEYNEIVGRLPELGGQDHESRIAEKGSIRDSFLASGVEIEGVVEGSILFPGVVVHRNAVVSGSVILNGNRVGTASSIHNSLILPYAADSPRSATNIGDKCSIGARSSTMKNSSHPDQIRGGITVVGMNAELPPGLRVEAGAFIDFGVSSESLRKQKVVRRGASVQET